MDLLFVVFRGKAVILLAVVARPIDDPITGANTQAANVAEASCHKNQILGAKGDNGPLRTRFEVPSLE